MSLRKIYVETLSPLKTGENPRIQKLAYTGGSTYTLKNGKSVKKISRGVTIPSTWLYNVFGEYKNNIDVCLQYVNLSNGKPCILVYPK